MRRAFSPLAYAIALQGDFLANMKKLLAEPVIDAGPRHSIGPGQRYAVLCKQTAPRSKYRRAHSSNREVERRLRQTAARS